MEILILVVSVSYLVLLIVMIVKFFQISSDVRKLKNSIISHGSSKSKQTFERDFYSLMLAGNTSKAKEILFKEICSTEEFSRISVLGVNEKFFISETNALKNKFGQYLSLVECNNINFEILKKQ